MGHLKKNKSVLKAKIGNLSWKSYFYDLGNLYFSHAKKHKNSYDAGANLDADNFIANCKSAAASVTSTCKYQSTRIQIAF